MPGKKLLPFIKLVPGNVEAFAKLLEGRSPEESFCQDTEDEEKPVTRIRDDHIREDSVGVPTASTDQPEDSDLLYDRLSMDKVDDAAAIVGMDPAVKRGTADGAGLSIRMKGSHVGVKQNF